jgi:hypothetical protein
MAETLSLPFSGRSPIARHHSAQAAEAAAPGRATKTLQYLRLLAEAGERGLTDHETVKATGWPLSSVCSIRNGCGELVIPSQEPGISPYGRAVTRWRRRA